MKLSNFIGFGISGVICAGLLGACADGRGTNGFKSYQYSKEERAINKAKYDKLHPAPVNPNQNTPPPDDSAKAGDIGTGSSAPLAVDSGRGTGEDIFKPAPPESAQSRVIAEPGRPNPSAVPSLLATVEKLNLTIEGELKIKAENSVAKGLVKGITILPTGGANVDRKITIQAVVKIAGEELYMDAANIPVKYMKGEESTANMLFILTKPCDNKVVMVKDLLQAVAKCRDENCLAIEVVLIFKTQGRAANAIFVVTPGKNADGKIGWQYFATNVGTPKTFVDAQKACEAPKPAKPEVEAGADTAPGHGAVGTGTSAPEVERAAADAARCEELKKEGFSCDDSPGEIARMKNNRRAHEAAVKAERERQDANAQNDQLNVGGTQSPSHPTVAAPTVQDDTNADREDGR